MQPPILESFGLSGDEYRAAKSLADKVMVSLLLAVFLAVEAWYLMTAGVHIRDGFWPVLGALFAGIWLAAFPLALALPLITATVPALFRKANRNFRNAEAFDKAKKEFEEWVVRTERLFWMKLTGLQFEQEVASLFKRCGYNATLTKVTSDGGVDIWINEPDGNVVVQCKAHAKPIGPGVARELYGTLKHFQAKRALLVSRSGFSPGVTSYAKGKPIDLMSLEQLIALQRRLKNGL